MAGLPSRYAKMGFKRGWKAYRAAHSYTTHKTYGMEGIEGKGRGGHKRGKKISVSHYLLGGDMSTPALVSRPVKRLSGLTPGKIVSPIIDLALIIAGMALGAKVKQLSPVKNPHLMNGVQAVVGLGGSLMVRNRFARMPLIGVALQSAIAEAKILMPKMIPLAGDDEVMYLPVGEDDEEQIEMRGTDERVGAVVVGQDEEVEGDERVGAVVVGQDDEEEGMDGEGENA